MTDNAGMIDQAISILDNLADAKGTLRCAYVYELYKILSVVKEGIETQEKIHKQEIDEMEEKLKPFIAKEGE